MPQQPDNHHLANDHDNSFDHDHYNDHNLHDKPGYDDHVNDRRNHDHKLRHDNDDNYNNYNLDHGCHHDNVIDDHHNDHFVYDDYDNAPEPLRRIQDNRETACIMGSEERQWSELYHSLERPGKLRLVLGFRSDRGHGGDV
jgi:hypothetical protein